MDMICANVREFRQDKGLPIQNVQLYEDMAYYRLLLSLTGHLQ